MYRYISDVQISYVGKFIKWKVVEVIELEKFFTNNMFLLYV